MILLTLILTSGVCLADNFVGGIPLTSVHSGTVSGGVYCDSYYGTADQAIHTDKTIDKTFTLPDDAEVEWAMLLTTVYCGHMQNNYQGTATVSFNDKTLGTETLNVPYEYITNGGNDGKAYVQVNDHVDRVTSDYMMYYDVTSLVKSGKNKATVHTEPTDKNFDGRIKLITLIVAYNDGSGKKIWYQVNRGHDPDTYYVDDNRETYVGSTAFKAALPSDASLTDATLTDVHMASTDGSYTFNGKALTSGTPQGTYCGLDSWDVTDDFKSTGTNTLTYDRTGAFYKNALAILTAEYTTSSSDNDSGDNSSDNNSGDNSSDNNSGDNSPDNNSGDNSSDNGSGDNSSDNNSGDNSSNGSGDNSSDNDSGQTVSSDLSIQDLKVLHNNGNKVWDNLNNTVKVNITNSGPDDAGDFAVELYAETALVESKPVSGLANGAAETVELNWKPEEAKNYTLKAVIVPGSTINDPTATNNKLSKTQEVQHNGYAGDKPLETYAHNTVKGDIIYDYGDSKYSGKVSSGSTYTVNHNLKLPANATIKLARLYNYWTWSATGTTGVDPSMSLKFQGTSLNPEAKYSDQKGWGSVYDYPSGTWAYDVTDLVKGSGNYTTVVTNINSETGNFVCFDGIGLLVVYEDATGNETEYWINEGCDMVSTMSTSGGLTPEDATVKIPFNGSINLSNVDSAKLWTTVQSGGHDGIILQFNEMNKSGVYDSTPYSDLDIDEARPVDNYLLTKNNMAQIIAPSVTDNSGDYLAPSSAILAVSYKGGTSDNGTSDNGTSDNGTSDNGTSDNGTSDNGTSDNGTSDNGTSDNGTSDNGTSDNGTSDNGTSDNGTSDNGTSDNGTSSSGSDSATVSLTVNITPVICLQVTPNSVDFGTLKPGTTSESVPLTLKNNGHGSIKVTAEVEDQDDGPFNTGLMLDQNKCSDYSKTIASNTSETSEAQLELPENYSSTGQFNGSLIFWAEAA
ncbi:hypothetical protein MSBRW_1933 [Methanosarcina barkeri str. Wiesmoor]|uniref:Uncharacterized protein n=2 Tax=Methanosarcina barkeri TaxID=2208 RepID=A0A0E3LLF6_METBA|nr:DUF3344 domain-containing protein [Methanosarcina barkeri]AKB51186.1 hypothetical protein MSBRW_1933 [Methanosarcina barkeri str. Wiesmoor]